MNLRSWKTSLGGLAAIFTGIGAIAAGISAGDWSVIGTAGPAVLAGIALLFARDNNVTSEEAGAK